MKKSLLLLAAMLLISGVVLAKKTNVLNIEKGELPNDTSEGMKVNLSEEQSFTKGGVSLKIECPKYPCDGWWVGEYGPKKGVWDGFDYLRFEYFNPNKTPQSMSLILKPAGSDYNTRMDQPIMMRPGKGVCEIELTGACANNGSAMDFKKKLQQWNLSGKLDGPIYIGNVQLYTADELEKLNGEGDSKPAKEEKKK